MLPFCSMSVNASKSPQNIDTNCENIDNCSRKKNCFSRGLATFDQSKNISNGHFID